MRPCSDFMDMLQRLINCHIITIIIIVVIVIIYVKYITAKFHPDLI